MKSRRNREFEAFFRKTKDPVFRSLIVAVGARDAAEEAVAEAFTRALANWASVRRHPTPEGWVTKTALNYARSTHRAMVRVTTDDVPDVPVSDDPPIDPEVIRRLLALPQRQREVIAFRVVLGLSTKDTAEFLQIAEGTVTAHLFRGLTRLQEELAATAPKEAWS